MPERHTGAMVIRPATGARPLGMTRGDLPRKNYVYRGTGEDTLTAHMGADLPFCPLCGNVNPAGLGPVTGTCLDSRACRRRQAGQPGPEEDTGA